MDRNRAPSSIESEWNAAVSAAAHFAERGEPDLIVVFYPDHLNGFLYNLLPSFCIGARGASIGDFGTAPGILDIPEDLAASCATHCVMNGIDIAISYDMKVDHGGVQPLELLSTERNLTRHIPIFINCAAAPRPTFARVRALGGIVGDWAAARPERILIVGSGGLSHDPPLPALASASGAVRRRLLEGGPLSHPERVTRQRRVYSEGLEFSAGRSSLRSVNSTWDRRALESLARGNLSLFDNDEDDAITAAAGCGAHEVRCWVAALSSVGRAVSYSAEALFYSPVNEWITGMAVLTASPAS